MPGLRFGEARFAVLVFAALRSREVRQRKPARFAVPVFCCSGKPGGPAAETCPVCCSEESGLAVSRSQRGTPLLQRPPLP